MKKTFIKWNEFFEKRPNQMVVFRVIPRSNLTNSNNNKKMWRLLHKMYEIYEGKVIRMDFKRKKKLGIKISYREKDTIWTEVVFKSDEGQKKIEFYLATTDLFTDKFKQIVESKLHVTLEEAEIKELEIPFQNTVVQELRYLRHDIFSMNTSAQEQTTPIANILQTIEDVEDGDMVRLSVAAEVVPRKKWAKLAEYAHEKVSKGKTPQRNRMSATRFLKASGTLVSGIVNEANSLIMDTLKAVENTMFKGYKNNEVKKEEVLKQTLVDEIHESVLSNRTRDKKNLPVFKTHIRVAVHSENKLRRELVSNQLSAAYSELGENNELNGIRIRFNKRKEQVLHEMNTLQLSDRTRRDVDANVLSSDEIASITKYPTRDLQLQYQDELQVNTNIHTEVSKGLFEGGIKLGTYTDKTQSYDVFQPVKDHDELCLPHVVIGGMGQGKTAGYGANFIVQSVLNGFGGLAIDPAKGQIGDEIESFLPADKVVRIRFGDTPISLDWREVEHSSKAKNRLANTVLSFFNNTTDETGVQTARYIRAAVMAMQTGKLAEIMRILEDTDYRTEVMEDVSNELHYATLAQLNDMTDARRAQVLSPIYNRLDVILGDEYLNECMNTDEGIDMVELMSQRKAIIIDVPKSELGPEGVELIVNLLTTKIDLAMTLRTEENQFPFFVLYDEPHQFIKSAKLWKAAAVESRKWRVGYIWMFHSWEQIPRDLAEIIKAAGPHYHLYPSSKKTFQELKEEIAPISVEEALTLKRYHAINILRTGGEVANPFVAHMSLPPSKQKKEEIKPSA